MHTESVPRNAMNPTRQGMIYPIMRENKLFTRSPAADTVFQKYLYCSVNVGHN